MTQEGFKRKLTAILSADAVGYSRLMGEDEAATVYTISAYRNVISTLIKQYNGTVIDSPGDNLLAEFVSVVDGVQCAVAVQKEIEARNDELPEDRRMQFRIGINLGDVIEEEDRIYGDGVNIAARLEALAEPGGICISKTAFDQIESKLPYGYESLGDQTVKNIAKPVSAYRVLMEPRVTDAGEPEAEKRSPTRRIPIFVGTVAVLMLALAVGVWQFYARRPAEEPASKEKMSYPLPDKPSIVVLPFDNLSKDSDQDYLVDGITDQIITGLSMIPDMFVIAKESSFSYKNKDIEIRQISEELGVQYVLEGSVQVSGNRIRITAQLIDALSGHHLWSERYDRELDDLFALQDEIMMKIMPVMQLKVAGVGILDDELAPTSVEAFKKMLKGAEYVHRATNKNDYAHAKKLYEEAIALSPDYGPLYRVLAWVHFYEALFGWSDSPAESLVLMTAGKNDEAISVIERAIRLNPITPSWYFHYLGMCYANAGRYEEAIEAVKKAIQKNANNPFLWLSLAAYNGLIDRDEKVREATEEFLIRYPSASIKKLKSYVKYKDPARERFWLDAYRKAGIPEN